ncbi:phosphonate ABC transporter substrate-binding protein [Acidithiobacillus marinus]|uniref:Phosphonate ABC transporter substrate-binding protein n=1 Tax=Acidithiobacillus marinus TaxID=187490 RepID=A0A2I1DL82_9PROT|nr:PhnD/SsuA/transferrin family substrate-binding protein [Acidithiobacillus marinus]PKY10631.1 phosphonate ABC transporter substrate-binding protein [Acidithiobacillus marinus]
MKTSIRIWLWMILCCFALPAQADLSFLLPPVSSPAIMYAAFTPLAKYLSQVIGQKITLHFSANLQSFYDQADKKTPQMVLFCPISYIRSAHQQAYYPLAGIIPTPGGNHSVIVVRSNSPIHNVLQLKNRSFVMGDPACAASSLVPLSMFRELGMTPKSFSAFRQSGSDQSALMDVAARFYDATAVAKNVAAPYLHSGALRIIADAAVGPGDLLAASAGVPATLRKQLTEALLRAKRRDPASIHALGGLAAGFQPINDGDYNALRTLYQEIHGVQLSPKVPQQALTLGIPPTFTPIAAYRIFAPLQKALSAATGRAVQLVIPSDEQSFVQDGQKGKFDFALLTPKMVVMEKNQMLPLARSVSQLDQHGLAIIRRDNASATAANPLRIAFASPYCSARSLAEQQLLRLAGKRSVVWVPEGSERAVFTALAENRAELGIVRSATVRTLEKQLPGIWSVVHSAGRAPVWTLTVKRTLNREQRMAVQKHVADLPANALDTAGFMGFRPLAHV